MDPVSNVYPTASLSAASSVGAGTSLDTGALLGQHGLVVIPGPDATAGVVALQGSVDNAEWFTLTTVTTNAAVAGQAIVVKASAMARYLRASVISAITGDTVTAFVGSTG